MSKAHLGEVFDIHGGGLDLIFPHHENEIAQSRCANGPHGTDVMANYWMHNGFLQVEGQKMSKSLGNFHTIAEVLADWPGEVVRFTMLKTHYRQPIDWTLKNLDGSMRTLSEFFVTNHLASPVPKMTEGFLAALQDDLNTPLAIAELHKAFAKIDFTDFYGMLGFLGFIGELEKPSKTKQLSGNVSQHIVALISARLEARKAKNWAESDRLRDELTAMGIEIEDHKDGTTTWKVKR